MIVDCTPQIIAAAEFGIAHRGIGFLYSEGSNRLNWQTQHKFTMPWTGDCSSFCDWCYVMGGAPPPAKGTVIFTGTLIAGGTVVSASELIAGNLVIYFADASLTGSGVHAAIIVNEPNGHVNTANPLTISMGHQGCPEYVRVNDDGRPHRFYKYDTTKLVPTPPPIGPPQKALPVTFTTKVPNALLKRGMIGWQVRWLQTALGQKTNFPYWFGKTTQAKLGHFQRTNGLIVTGTTNPATWKALGA